MIGRSRGMLVAVLASTMAYPATAQRLGRSSPLEALPFGVGYRQFWIVDSTRTYDWSHLTGAPPSTIKSPRPLLVAVWYPAKQRAAAHMRQVGYFDPDAPALFGPFARALMKYSQDATVQALLTKPLAAASAAERRYALDVLNAPALATRNAAAASGQFPIVVYHAGANAPFTDNTDLCEYLASRGYVVVSSAYQQADGRSFNVSVSDGSSVLDMRLLIARMGRESNADWRRVAVIGHSAGAQSALVLGAWPQSPVDAIVSLDNTEDYNSLREHAWDAITVPIIEAAPRYRTPLLFAAGAGAIFEMADTLTSSDRWLLTTRHLRHEDYTSLGIAARAAAVELRVDSANTRADRSADAATMHREYMALCDRVRLFLDATLKADPSAQQALRTYGRATRSTDSVELTYEPSGTNGIPYDPSPDILPSPAQLRRLIGHAGASSATGLIRPHWPRDSAQAAFNPLVISTLLFELSQQGDSIGARTLFDGFRAIDSRFTVLTKFMGFIGDMRGNVLRDPIDADAWYRAVLMLDPADEHARSKVDGRATKARRP